MRASLLLLLASFGYAGIASADCVYSIMRPDQLGPSSFAPLGPQTGLTYHVYQGAVPQIYRVCKAGAGLNPAARPQDDCDIDLHNENGKITSLPRTKFNLEACADIEGKTIVVKAVPPPPGAGTGTCDSTAMLVRYCNVTSR